MLGYLLEGVAAHLIGHLNVRLERDVVRMRGLRVSLETMDYSEVLDPGEQCIGWLKSLERKVLKLRAEALKSRNDRVLRKIDASIARTAELCLQLHEAVVELRLAIIEHDARAAGALVGSGALVYELTDRQAEQFEECRMSEREPTARMREAGRRYSALVTSR
jgi:hypothetical protein